MNDLVTGGRWIVVGLLVVVLILAVGVLADSKDVKQEIVDLVEERGVVVDEEAIMEVNFSDLPDEVDIEKIENTSIVIYRVDYGERPLFVISSSGEKKSGVSAPVCEARMLLHFGSGEEMRGSGFLNMAGGVESSFEKGYVMMKAGSITGISSNLEIVDGVEGGSVDVVIYKNGEEIGFRNILSASSSGVVVDFDVQSKGIVSFKAGDVVSVYLDSVDGVSLLDVTTTVEVSV